MATHINIFREVENSLVRLGKIRDIGMHYFDLFYRSNLRKSFKNQEFKDKVVIITGASSGIGKECAIAYAGRGAKVVLAARNYENLIELKNEIHANKGEAICIKTDVTFEDDCKNLINETINNYGKIDILISNAGLSMRALFSEVDLKVLKSLMDVNFWGLVYCSKYALPYLLRSKGSLVAVSSMAAFTALPARTGYCASKSAVNGFINALRLENLKKDIHIMLVSPGFTESNMRRAALNKYGKPQVETPIKEEKLMPANEVANRILKANIAKKRSLILTFNGKMAFFVNKFKPTLVEKVLYNKMVNETDSPLE